VAASFESPMSSLAPLRGLVVIDEAQRCPQIFPVLRVLVDREDNAARFLILGSASHGSAVRDGHVSSWLQAGFHPPLPVLIGPRLGPVTVTVPGPG